MENTSTPVSNRDKWVTEINKIGQNEKILQDYTVSPLFDNISPIKNKKMSGQINNCDDNTQDEHNSNFGDNEIQKKHCLTVDNNDVRDEHSLNVDDLSSSTEEFDNSLLSDNSKEIDCSLADEIDCSLADEFDLENIKDTIYELRQAVPMYINKLKSLDLSSQWDLSEECKPEKGLTKSTKGLKGRLDPEELSFIKKRLIQFCEVHNINYAGLRLCMSEHVTKFSFPNEIRLKFIQYLCKDYLDNRNPWSLYRSILKLGLRTGRFSENETNFIIEMYQNYRGLHFHSVCGLLLNRHRHNIYLKVNGLKKSNHIGARPSAINTKHKRSKLRKLLLKNILTRKNFELPILKKCFNVRTWRSIGREYNMSPAVAKAIYICDIMPQMFANHPVKFTNFFIKLFKSVYNSHWITWEEVKWDKLSCILYDTGPFFVYTMLRKIVMNYVPQEKWKNFKECSDYLYHNVLPSFKDGFNRRTDRKLNQLIIQKGSMDC